jgi:hypothetical protein
MRNEGKAVPMPVHNAPRVFFNLYPIKTLIFMAKAPGQLCAYSYKVTKSFLVPIHLFLSTTSDSITGIMACPPPKVNMPILKNVLNDFQ